MVGCEMLRMSASTIRAHAAFHANRAMEECVLLASKRGVTAWFHQLATKETSALVSRHKRTPRAQFVRVQPLTGMNRRTIDGARLGLLANLDFERDLQSRLSLSHSDGTHGVARADL